MLKKIPAWLFLFLLCCVNAGVWMYFKLVTFDLCMYSSDLFSHMQISRSWLVGRPFMYENAYGPHNKIHNYYIDPLLGVFTYFGGVYGLFLAHLCFILAGALAILYLYRLSEEKYQKRLLVLILLVFYMGPVSFYIWDNPGYAFHVEQLYVPLSILFCAGLIRANKWLTAISALLIVICKEDGIVLLGCLQLSWLLMQPDSWRPENRKKLVFSLIKTLGICFVVFVAGLWLLSYKNGYQGSRVAEVWAKIKNQPSGDIVLFYKRLLTDFFLKLLPVLVFILLFIKAKKALFLPLFLIPVLIVQLYSSSFYYPALQFGLVWPPRLGMLWAYIVAFFLMAIMSGNMEPFFAKIKYSYPALIIFGLSLFLLQRIGTEDYEEQIERCEHGKKEVEDYADMQVIRKLTMHLPDTIDIQSHNRFFCLFPYNSVVWDDVPENRWKKPEVILSRWDSFAVANQAYTKPYRRIKVGKFTLFVKPGVKLDGE